MYHFKNFISSLSCKNIIESAGSFVVKAKVIMFRSFFKMSASVPFCCFQGLMLGEGRRVVLEDTAFSLEEPSTSWEINTRLLSTLSSVFYILDFQMKMVIVAIFAYNSSSLRFDSVRILGTSLLLLSVFVVDYFFRLSHTSVHSLILSVTL